MFSGLRATECPWCGSRDLEYDDRDRATCDGCGWDEAEYGME